MLSVLRELEPEFGLTDYLYQTGSRAAGTEDQYRVTLRSRDAEFFREHVQTVGGIPKLAAITRELTDPQKHVRDNAIFFRTELEKLTPAHRQRIASYIVQRCCLVVVSTPDEDSAFRIFSVLNDRGRDLSHADIPKAELVSRIEGQALQDAYATKWDEVEEALGREEFKDLFAHLRMIYRRAKLDGTVLAEFREYVIKSEPDPRKLTDDVVVAGGWAFEQIQRSRWDGESSDRTGVAIEELLGWLNRLENRDWVPVAIQILQTTKTASDVLASLAALERLAAFLLATRATVNERVRRYGAVLEGMQKDSPAPATTALQLSEAERGEFVAALDGELYVEPKVRVYVLLRLDRALGDASAKYDSGTITVEHVLPQTPRDDSEWLTSFPTTAERSWTHRLGNLFAAPAPQELRSKQLGLRREEEALLHLQERSEHLRADVPGAQGTEVDTRRCQQAPRRASRCAQARLVVGLELAALALETTNKRPSSAPIRRDAQTSRPSARARAQAGRRPNLAACQLS